ncbi:acetyl-CoA carboxylase biotin carboxylase subunit family protein [Nocardia sp. NPDC088792]|uniref:ATP-grasp domain-containing protein n=1 Tax=Nocardia sp. NPDC088792 TaxID=3364332 RepID=UPI003815A64E
MNDTFLVLNTKGVLSRLPEWFPDARRELVVVGTPATLAGSGLDDPAAHFRHVHTMAGLHGARAGAEIVELCRRFAVTRILSTGEREVLPAARLRGRLGLPGQGLACAGAYRDKFVMKTIAAAAGIPVAPMRQVADSAALREFACEAGFPVVVKPLDGGGSAGVRVFGAAAELENALGARDSLPWPEPVLAEAWIEGSVYHVNGLMGAGAVVTAHPSLTPHSNWRSLRFAVPAMSAMLPEDDPMAPRLLELTERVIAALPPVPGACAFHAEFFHTPEDRLVLCEIACRAGGGEIVPTHEAVFGVNLHGASLLGQAGRNPPRYGVPRGPRQGFVNFPPARGVLRRIPRRCPLPNVLTYAASGEVGRAYENASSLGTFVAGLTHTLHTPDVRSELHEIEQWWERNTVWEN